MHDFSVFASMQQNLLSWTCEQHICLFMVNQTIDSNCNEAQSQPKVNFLLPLCAQRQTKRKNHTLHFISSIWHLMQQIIQTIIPVSSQSETAIDAVCE